MRKILMAGVAFAALSAASVQAADLATRPYTKAPIAPAVVGYNWSGFYAGVMGGYGWSDRVSVGGVTTSSSDLQGGFGGGQIGYNWQAPGSQWVWGLEVDAAASDIKYSETGFIGIFPVSLEDKVRSFGSVTGRIGFTTGPALIYAKGGYAWADNRISLTVLGLNYTESKVLSGWTVGGGVEYMLAPNWSIKGEYMYADYGSSTYLTGVVAGGVDLGATTHTVKGGINYHFQ